MSNGIASVCLLVLLFTGCTPNKPFRILPPAQCGALADERCERALIQKYDDFDLAFVEFTDRGNLFSRARFEEVLDHINEAQRCESLAVFVYVHGWKHNASDTDSNVVQFRDMLGVLADKSTNITYRRRPIGVYIGWRGKVLDLWGVRQATYWNRKSVAQQIGKGGVTEVLLRLQHLLARSSTDKPDDVVCQDGASPKSRLANQENLYLVVGHSFGGAIVLSAMNEILVDRILSAQALVAAQSSREADDSDREAVENSIQSATIGNGLVLLNPAIEATEGLQLKEVSRLVPFPAGRAPLMHVISTDADRATGVFFPMGQRLGLWNRKTTTLERQFDDKSLAFSESALDATTIGNLKSFRTSRLTQDTNGGWSITTCDKPTACGLSDAEAEQHLGAVSNDPLSFVSTSEKFIRNHNDIFNCNVSAYLAAVVEGSRAETGKSVKRGCMTERRFDLLNCFTTYHKLIRENQANLPVEFCPLSE